MGKFRQFIALSRQEKWLYWSAALWLVGVKAGLALIPFGRLTSGLERLGEPAGRVPDPRELRAIIRAIERVSRWLSCWRINCLPQALAAHTLLRRRGFRGVELKMGVCKGPLNTLAAHAWLECGGQVLLGDGRDLKLFTPFSAGMRFK